MTAKWILLVEDNPRDEELTLRAFRKNDTTINFVVVRDGSEALDYLFARGIYAARDASVLPDVVLLDLKLPKVNGLEVLHRIRGDDQTRLLPVIVLTASKEEKDLVDGYSAGCNSYVRKSVDFNQFAEAARQLGLYWFSVNERPPRIGRP